MSHRHVVLFAPLLLSLLLGGLSHALSPLEKEDPTERRAERLLSFREKRDRFFKEDSRSPLKEPDRKHFKGLSYFPIDLAYAIVGTIDGYAQEPRPTYVTLPTNKGTGKRYVRYGRFRFRLDGRDYVLQVYRPLGETELFLPFKDRTSGAESHADGRYLFVEHVPAGKVLIDFNRAYNPFCEYNEKYTCPLPLQENWLPIPVRAGEKRFR